MDEWQLLHTFEASRYQFLFLGFDFIETDSLDIFDSGYKAYRPFHVLGARLKFRRQFRVGGFLLMDVFDHVAAHEEWFHVIQKFFFAIEHADAAHGAHFVSRESKEITIQVLHVHFLVWRRLGAIQNDDSAVRVSTLNQWLRIKVDTKHIGYLSEGKNFHLRIVDFL